MKYISKIIMKNILKIKNKNKYNKIYICFKHWELLELSLKNKDLFGTLCLNYKVW